MNINFTPWLAANWLIVSLLVGFGWALGGWLWGRIAAALVRGAA